MNDGIRGMEKVEARMTFVFPACMTRFTETGTNREDQTSGQHREDRFQCVIPLSWGHAGGNTWMNESGAQDEGQNGDIGLRVMGEIHGALVLHFEVQDP